jgi:hypothetical protein
MEEQNLTAKEQKLIDMVEFFRTKLFEEQCR